MARWCSWFNTLPCQGRDRRFESAPGRHKQACTNRSLNAYHTRESHHEATLTLRCIFPKRTGFWNKYPSDQKG